MSSHLPTMNLICSSCSSRERRTSCGEFSPCWLLFHGRYNLKMRSSIFPILPIPKKEDLAVLWVTKSAQKNGPPKQLFVPTAGSGLLSVGHTHVLNSHLCWMPIKRTDLQVRRVSSTMSMEVKYVNLLCAEGECMLKMLGRTAVRKNKRFVLCCKVSLIQHAKLILMQYIVLAPCLHYAAYCFYVWVNQDAQHFRQHRKWDKPGFFHCSLTSSMVHSGEGPLDWKEQFQLGAPRSEWRWRSWRESCGGAVEEQGKLPVFPSLGSHKRDWNNLRRCHCFPPLSSASGESQSLGRLPGVRLVYDDAWITKHLNNIKGSVGGCGRKSHFLSLKPSRIAPWPKPTVRLQSAKYNCTAQGIRLPPPCLSQHPSPTINCTSGFPLDKRERQQTTLDVSYGINGRNSDATLREAFEDLTWYKNYEYSGDIRKEMGSPMHFLISYSVSFSRACISINNTHQYFLLPWQKHWKSEPIYLAPNKIRSESRLQY